MPYVSPRIAFLAYSKFRTRPGPYDHDGYTLSISPRSCDAGECFALENLHSHSPILFLNNWGTVRVLVGGWEYPKVPLGVQELMINA